MSNACRITEQLENGTSIIEYIDLKSNKFDQDYQKTSFIQSEEIERLENTRYIEGKRTRELSNIKKTFKIDHKIVEEVQKRWVKKIRKVKKPHICIHEKLVEKSIQVDTVKIGHDVQEKQRTSYTGVTKMI